MSISRLPVTDLEWEDGEEIVCTRDLAAYDERVAYFDTVTGAFIHNIHRRYLNGRFPVTCCPRFSISVGHSSNGLSIPPVLPLTTNKLDVLFYGCANCYPVTAPVLE